MKLRKRFVPKTSQDACVFAFVVVIVPIVYWFELFVVLPKFYEPWSPWYAFHFLTGTFILFNVTTNFVGVVVCETGVAGVLLPATLKPNWRFCSACECVAPPRSWHCSVCDTCILKRDHHCIFTGCCVGHYNARYFLMFVLYIFVATLYATYYNLHFIYGSVELWTWWTLVKFVFPLAMVFVEFSSGQLFLFLVLIVTISCVFAGILLYFHATLMFRGAVTHERRKNLDIYNYGIADNVRIVLGERWYLTWLSPLIRSQLTHDGIDWVALDTAKTK